MSQTAPIPPHSKQPPPRWHFSVSLYGPVEYPSLLSWQPVHVRQMPLPLARASGTPSSSIAFAAKYGASCCGRSKTGKARGSSLLLIHIALNGTFWTNVSSPCRSQATGSASVGTPFFAATPSSYPRRYVASRRRFCRLSFERVLLIHRSSANDGTFQGKPRQRRADLAMGRSPVRTAECRRSFPTSRHGLASGRAALWPACAGRDA